MMTVNIPSLISSFVAIVVCLLSWYLVRLNINADLKRRERNKINRLITHLLELQYWVNKEIAFDEQIKEFLDIFGDELSKQQPQVTAEDFGSVREKIVEIIKRQLPGYLPLEELENNIKDTVKELAEIDPVLAFELSGKYQLTANSRSIQSLMDNAVEDAQTDGLPELVVGTMLRPQMLKDLQADLRLNIPLIAKKSDKQTYQRVRNLCPTTLPPIDKEELSRLMAGYLRPLFNAQQELFSSES